MMRLWSGGAKTPYIFMRRKEAQLLTEKSSVGSTRTVTASKSKLISGRTWLNFNCLTLNPIERKYFKSALLKKGALEIWSNL